MIYRVVSNIALIAAVILLLLVLAGGALGLNHQAGSVLFLSCFICLGVSLLCLLIDQWFDCK